MLDRGHGTGQGILSCLIACSARTEAEWFLHEKGSEAPFKYTGDKYVRTAASIASCIGLGGIRNVA